MQAKSSVPFQEQLTNAFNEADKIRKPYGDFNGLKVAVSWIMEGDYLKLALFLQII